MRIAIPAEMEAGETRVAATPETVRKFITLGAIIVIGAGAGRKAGILDGDFQAAGATISRQPEIDADIVLKVRRPSAIELLNYKSGALLVAMMDPYGNESTFQTLISANVTSFAMELLPRITRAQAMDVLSSQANLAGYRAVIDASAEFGRALPMMMTAAGTVPAARVFVMGAGVAGLQAIATARRLGAIVTATDVRPAAKEQVESLGAKFIAVEDDEFKQAETTAGYAKPMSENYQAKQALLVSEHIKKQDIVITTALIPGREAPRLVSAAMVASLKPGSIIVDLAAERGGNVEGTKAGEITRTSGEVKIIGYTNSAARIAASASALYAKNLFAFVETLLDKDTKALRPDWSDELVRATLLTRGGEIVHHLFPPKTEKEDKPSPSVEPSPASLETSPDTPSHAEQSAPSSLSDPAKKTEARFDISQTDILNPLDSKPEATP